MNIAIKIMLAAIVVVGIVELIRQRGHLGKAAKVLTDWVVLSIDFVIYDRYRMIRRLSGLAPYRQKSLIFKILKKHTYGTIHY